jgi:hypothetical protein
MTDGRNTQKGASLDATFALVTTFPLAFWGIVHHFLPYQIPRLVAQLVASDRSEISSVKLMTGLLVFPAWYALETWLALRFLPLTVALVFAGTLPLTGLIALLSLEGLAARRRRHAREAARGVAGPEALRKLKDQRADLLAELDRARAEILAREGRSGPPTGGS